MRRISLLFIAALVSCAPDALPTEPARPTVHLVIEAPAERTFTPIPDTLMPTITATPSLTPTATLRAIITRTLGTTRTLGPTRTPLPTNIPTLIAPTNTRVIILPTNTPIVVFVPTDTPVVAAACCKYCDPSKSKPCGDSCISLDKTCHKGSGCACSK